MLETITGIIIGLIAKPFQDWITYLFKGKDRKLQKREKSIEDAFHLTQKLKDFPDSLGATFTYVYLRQQSGISGEIFQNNFPKQETPDKEEVSKLRYILLYELSAPKEIITDIDDLQQDFNQGMRIILRTISKPLSPLPFPEDEYIEKFGSGNIFKAANTYRNDFNDKVNKLISKIEEFVKLEKAKLQNDSMLGIDKSFQRIKRKFSCRSLNG